MTAAERHHAEPVAPPPPAPAQASGRVTVAARLCGLAADREARRPFTGSGDLLRQVAEGLLTGTPLRSLRTRALESPELWVRLVILQALAPLGERGPD